MKIGNGKIIEATEDELFERYLKTEMDDIMPFQEYLERLKTKNVKIIKEV